MSKKKKCECPAGEKWAVPYADFLSLLLALFIALYALASVNMEKQKALKEEFVKLREITDNYTVPGDVCESYEAVYNMLAELDKAYEAYKETNKAMKRYK